MHYVKPHDPAYPPASFALATLIAEYMAKLKTKRPPTIDDERWCQEAVMLTLIDGVATIAASMGYPVEMVNNVLSQAYHARRREIGSAADGGLIVPGKIVI